MKKIQLILSFFVLASLIITSCKKDDKDARDQYVGTYNVSETFTYLSGSGTFIDTYTIAITKSSTKSNSIIISNFGNIGSSAAVEATVSDNSIIINSQTITYGGDIYGISGSGSINGSILNISYTVSGEWSGVCVCTKL